MPRFLKGRAARPLLREPAGRRSIVRLTDGPEEVHMSQLGKQKIAEYVAANRR